MNQAEVDDDVHTLTPSATVRFAAGLVVLEGFLAALGGVQLFMSVSFFSPWLALVPWLMLLLGLPTIYAGTQLYRMRGWAGAACAVCMALSTAGSGAWTLFAFEHGMVSCLTMIMPFVGFAGFAFSLVSLPACRLAERTRERLRAAGMDLGI